jgi:hypothetical protein
MMIVPTYAIEITDPEVSASPSLFYDRFQGSDQQNRFLYATQKEECLKNEVKKLTEENLNLRTIINDQLSENNCYRDLNDDLNKQIEYWQDKYKTEEEEWDRKLCNANAIIKNKEEKERELSDKLKENFHLLSQVEFLAKNNLELKIEIDGHKYINELTEKNLNKALKEIINIENICNAQARKIKEYEEKIEVYEIKIEDDEKEKKSLSDKILDIFKEFKKKERELEENHTKEKNEIIQMIRAEKQKEKEDIKKREEINSKLKSEIDGWKDMHQEASAQVEIEKKNVEKVEQQRLQQEQAFKEKDKTGKNLGEAGKQVAKETDRVVSQTNREVKRIFKKF